MGVNVNTVLEKQNPSDEVSEAQTPRGRIDVITLFGSQRLERDGDSRFWRFVSNATKGGERLTMRESMFINAALHAAGGR